MDLLSNTTNNEKVYINLKKKLEALQYNYPLGLESVFLVDKLLNDLIKTNEGFQKLKKISEIQKSELESEKQSTLPLRSENQKIVNENNSLHREMIKIKEEIDKKELKFESAIRKLNEEKEEMRFLIQQKDLAIKNAEGETDNIRRKLNEILQKVYGDYNNSGLAGAEKLLKTGTTKPMNIIGKKTEFFLPNAIENTITNHLNADTAFKSLNNNLSDKEEWARDLREADERAIKFRNETKMSEERNKELSFKIEGLDKQIHARDIEIKRLNDNYFLSDNLEEIKVKYQSNHLQSNVEKLNLQIDYLNKRNHDLEENNKYHETRCNGKTIKLLEKEIEKINAEKKTQTTKLAQLHNQSGDYQKESKYQISDKVQNYI